MKISHLFEDTNTQMFKNIIDSVYFEKNVAPNIDLDASDDDNYHALMQSGQLLFHGTRGEMDRVYTMKYRESPRDTVEFVHDTVNKYAMDKFGVPVRNLVFTTNSYEEASAYGALGVIMPLSHFVMYTNPTSFDFTVTYCAAHSMSDLDFNASLVSHFSEIIYDDCTRSGLVDKDSSYNDVLQDSIVELATKVFEHGVDLELDLVTDVLGIYERKSGVSEERFNAICKFVHERFKHYYSEYIGRLKDYVDNIEEIKDEVIRKDWNYREIMLQTKTFSLLSKKGLYALIKFYKDQNTKPV